MKFYITLIVLSFSFISKAAGVVYEHLPLNMIHGLRTHVDSVFIATPELKEAVKTLYTGKMINHYLEDDGRENFETYFSLYKEFWHFIDLNQDGQLELLFQGKYEATDDRAYTEIYTLSENKYVLSYVEIGALLGYKINPNNNEIILYTHEYPCCESYTHNISTLRFIRGEIKVKKKFFIARDKEDMKGEFFPDSLHFKGTYQISKQEIALYWSPTPITENAFVGGIRRLQTNLICHFPEHTLFRILAETPDAYYILITGKAKEENGLPINVANLEMIPIYGWIQKKAL
ncbi:hypothetical protein SAMN05216474_0493 [Lishizhenia tianjinensis]|uniref:Uncharacterized protein n=1 Tax=Lishizhenia tianjinensis TaxID=477690 RepID=A0A1I6XXI4_9FLAO|nr:hypothetical protein [Lishizhenia tianjinensis]SFT42514.1 hypothetical protein SAMN05216474_0493 [Lishizhenia tianjinensis]